MKQIVSRRGSRVIKIRNATWVSALCIIAFTVAPVSADTSLTFGVYTSDKPTAMVKQFRPILNALETKLSERRNERVKIRMQIAKDYGKGIEALVKGDVDFARLGPASYVEAKELSPNIEILAMERNKGEKTFKGVIIVRNDGPIRSIADLRGKSFAFGDERSTIGRYLSQQYLAEHGITCTDLARYEYLGRHDKVAAAVTAGIFDAGALKENTFARSVQRGEPLKALASFLNVTKPWVAQAEMAPSLRSNLREALLEVTDKAVLRGIKKDGFVHGSDEDYAYIRSSIQNNKVFFQGCSSQRKEVSSRIMKFLPVTANWASSFCSDV